MPPRISPISEKVADGVEKKPRSRQPRKKNEIVSPLLTTVGTQPAADRIDETKSREWLYPTNHFNLATLLACGYIKPRSGFSKYYSDLLELSLERIPFVRGPLTNSVLKQITREGSSYPVILEVSRQAITPNSEPAKQILVNRTIPLTDVETIHFRNEFEHLETIARDYNGIDLNWFKIAVSPELFDSSEADDDNGLSWLADTLPEAVPLAFSEIDRRAGGLAALIVGSTRLAVASSDITSCVGILPKPTIEGVLRSIDYESGIAASDADENGILLAASIRILRKVDRHLSWNPPEIVRAINTMLVESGFDDEKVKPIVETLRIIWSIVKRDSRYRDLSALTAGRAANALLRVLTRPEPETEAIFGSHAKVNTDDWTRTASCVLSGTLNGFEMLPLDLRPASSWRFLWNWQTSNLNTSAPPRDLKIDLKPDKWTLIFDGDIVAHGTSLDAVGGDAVIQSDNQVTTVDSLFDAETRGWLDLITYEISGDVDGSMINIRDGKIVFRRAGPVLVIKTLDEEAYSRRKSGQENRSASVREG